MFFKHANCISLLRENEIFFSSSIDCYLIIFDWAYCMLLWLQIGLINRSVIKAQLNVWNGRVGSTRPDYLSWFIIR